MLKYLLNKGIAGIEISSRFLKGQHGDMGKLGERARRLQGEYNMALWFEWKAVVLSNKKLYIAVRSAFGILYIQV